MTMKSRKSSHKKPPICSFLDPNLRRFFSSKTLAPSIKAMQKASKFERELELPVLKPIKSLITREIVKVKDPKEEMMKFFRPDLSKHKLKRRKFKEQGCQTTTVRSLQTSVICSPLITSQPYSQGIRTSSNYSSMRMKSVREMAYSMTPQPGNYPERSSIERRSPTFSSKELKLDPEAEVKSKPMTFEILKNYIEHSTNKHWVPR
mmetsp:Transcript_27990/g.50158  ORF Transcript_27990/g.50158 Transcript_27990/m.50158 type:complete len:205 (-) Transcript_27990:74-688(-)|eukprot:CAMPEP_0204903188 /NCGR_PEP_ID=MMETSP1397-20131031/4097_1 /ASSEMBLY_ACC=CAM_ASM_000891 /TAXON_ID=49980 /ORGANISM="Climacostomum Climacostomum virens, Strain Stock W-24" /LENGTH=204 /DNA_ID=CAMNT_0052071777 /DNA_START=127 /DNA_END=744 /DNA_ORIENTATION=+